MCSYAAAMQLPPPSAQVLNSPIFSGGDIKLEVAAKRRVFELGTPFPIQIRIVSPATVAISHPRNDLFACALSLFLYL